MDFQHRAMLLFCLALLLVPINAQAAGSRLHEFSSDGCSLFPNGTIANPSQWCQCCFEHDIAYWKGGTAAERLQADEALRACVQERTGSAVLAETMYDGVRAGGHPVFPNWYRWAYGWDYGRGYAPLTRREQRDVAGKLESYFKDHPAGYCAPRKP